MDWRRGLSRLVGWLADRRIPTPLRPFVIGAYCRATGARASEAQLAPRGYASLGAFFVRRLKKGARPFPEDPSALPSPCDGTVQAIDRIENGTLLQAKGQTYPVAELLDGLGDDLELEGGLALTIYLSPRDYHRVHAPLDARLTRVRWVRGTRYSVAPSVLARRARVLASNERAVLRLEGERTTLLLVMVGALNVGRIRVVGVAPGEDPGAGPTPRPRSLERGAELARFEMGSTVVLVFPAGSAETRAGLSVGDAVRLGEGLGSLGA